MKIKEIIGLVKGELIVGDYEAEIGPIEQDTRLIQHGDTFIAFKGENTDGNNFIQTAIEKGATSVIVNVTNVDTMGKKCNVIYVEDSLFALHEIIKYKLQNSNIKKIGITGSVGKTSTRDLIYEVLSTKFSVFKNEKNFNSRRGMPLTCSKIANEEIAVVELGMDGKGQIYELASILNPEIAVITNVGSSHIGQLGSRLEILNAKAEIIDGIKENGYLVINLDDDMLQSIKTNWHLYNKNNINLITYGINNPEAIFNVTAIKEHDNLTEFTIDISGIKLNFTINSVGKHNIYNALVAIVVSKILELNTEEIQIGLNNLKSTERRFQKLELNNITVYDDAYNASYESIKAAIDSFSRLPKAGRFIYILGDIFMLGEYAEYYHRKIGETLSKIDNLDVLITIGTHSLFINEELTEKNIKLERYHFKDVDSFLENILEFQANDTILVKASNGMNFKKIIDVLKEKYKKEEEWKKLPMVIGTMKDLINL